MEFQILNRFTGEVIVNAEINANKNTAKSICLGLAIKFAKGSNLQYADLQYADLQDANIDFSCLHLACKTFNVKWSDKHIFQFIAHITRANQVNLSDKAKEAVKALDKWKNEFCNYRDDIDKI